MGGNPGQSKVKVIVRVRPLLPHEPCTPCACAVDSRHVRLLIPGRTQSYGFKYDSCYDVDSHQETIFEKEIKARVPSIFEGLNTTVFAYGNTGAGKTYTMQGNEEQPGIIPRVAELLIDLLSTTKHKATLHMSYVELYNEKLYDLLLPSRGADLAIREDKSKNILIPDLSEVSIKSVANFKQYFETGCKNRSTGATKLNPNSSRSHAILMFKVQVSQGNTILTGKLNLIDLAGSEDNRKTGNKGIRLTESSNINQSLFVLGNVVNSLNSGTSRIPYRDSKLTRILQDSLGGASNAVMIANVAPTAAYYSDTLNTLNFALKSKNITNKPTVHSAEIVTLPPPIPVTSDLPATHAAENRKLQLEAWKKNKPQQSNKENQENFSAQIERMKQEMKKEVKQEMWLDVSSTVENIVKQFLSDQTTLGNISQHLRFPMGVNMDNALQPIDLPKNIGVMTPISQKKKIIQLLELAHQLANEWRYPQAIELYTYVLPYLPEEHQNKAKMRIAFLQQCLSKTFTPGSFKYKSRVPSGNATARSVDDEDESFSDDEVSGVDLFGAKAQNHDEESPTTTTTTNKLQTKQKPLQKQTQKEPLKEQKQKELTESKEQVKSKKPKPVMFTTPTKSSSSPPAIGYHTVEPAQRSYYTTYDDSDEEPTSSNLSAKLSEATIATKNHKLTAKAKINSAEKIESFEDSENFGSSDKTEKTKRPKKEKRYISSDEDYDDSEEKIKKRVSKKAKNSKKDKSSREPSPAPKSDHDAEMINGDTEDKILQVINSGDKKSLCMLNGVGDKRAQNILDYRACNSPFQRVSDLKLIKGITDNVVANILTTSFD